MSHNGFGFTGLPSLPDDPSKDNYAEFNAVGQAARAYEWTLSEEGPSEFNKQHVAEPSCTETQAPESRTYGSGPVQYPPSPAVGTEQPDDPVPPPPIHTQGQVITRSTPVTHHNGNQQAAVATETQPIIIDEARQRAEDRLLGDMAKILPVHRTQKGNEKTTACSVPVPKIKEPKAARQGSVQGTLKCSICEHRSGEVSRLRLHFTGCVAKHGNPGGVEWDADPSCNFDGIVLSRMRHAAAMRDFRARGDDE